jgi:hypothetical protein
MLELIPDLPAGVVGVEAKGKVEDTDYGDILVPAIEKVREEHGAVRFLYALGDASFGEPVRVDDSRRGQGVRHI